MRVKEIVLGIAAVASAAVMTACSSGATAQSGNDVHLAAGNAAASTTTVQTTTSTTTNPPATTTTTAPPVTHSASPQDAPVTQAAAAPAYAAGVPCHIVTGACADLSAHKVWIVRDGQIVFGPASIEPGTRSYPTPTGTFHVLSKVVNYHSREFDNALMKYSVFFYPGDAFHVGSLGIPSHGCIHMSYGSAQSFFSQMSVGEEVQIVG